MPNRNLNTDELRLANALLGLIRKRLKRLATGDPLLLFAYRRKIAKELQYDERGKPSHRKVLKALKWVHQRGRCAHCRKKMPLKYSHLDRKKAVDRYTEKNTELIHAECHHKRQAVKAYR